MSSNKELIESLEQNTGLLKQIIQKQSLNEQDKADIIKWLSKAKRTLKVLDVDDPQLDTDFASFNINTVDHDIIYSLKNIIPQVEGILESLRIENKNLFEESKIIPRFKTKR